MINKSVTLNHEEEDQPDSDTRNSNPILDNTDEFSNPCNEPPTTPAPTEPPGRKFFGKYSL